VASAAGRSVPYPQLVLLRLLLYTQFGDYKLTINT